MTEMRRYAALLRGVAPTNAKMPELKRAFEAAGFSEVHTVLTSGNVVFSARAAAEEKLARRAEAAMTKALGRSFYTIVRSLDALREILEADPFSEFRLPAESKRVVTFIGALPETKRALPKLPITADGARILCVRGSEIFTAYVPNPKGAAFMTLILKTFGNDVTTRTWGTIQKLVADRAAVGGVRGASKKKKRAR
jgi:uncharacterized protein (DUF1697 family)